MSPDDRNVDRGFDDRGFEDRAFDDRQSDRGMDRGFDDRNQFAEDRGLEDRQLEDDAQYADRGLDDRGLEQLLTASGREARMEAGGAFVNVVFAAALRERLVTKLETTRPPLIPFTLGRRMARVMPLAIAMLLVAVAMVGAAQLHIGAPDPSPSQMAASDQPTPTTGEPSGAPDASGDGQPIIPVDPSATPAPATPKPSSAVAPPPPPAATPVPTPVPPPAPEALSLSLKSCTGGVVVMWSKYHGTDFNHYTTLRNTSATIPLAYPPQGGAVDFGGTYTTDRFSLSAVDATGAPGVTYYYRTMAFTGADAVVGATSVVSAAAQPMASLGTLSVTPDPGGTAFTWSPFTGNAGCFTWYKLVASTTNPDPSYLGGDGYLWYTGNQGEVSTVVPDLVSGTTYYLRVQVIRSTALGAFVAAQTDVTTYTAP